MNQPLIRLTEIAAAYDQKKVLEHINLEIAEKDFLGVIGPNGGGKTTLMKIILGLLKPTAGKIQFFHQGKEVNEIRYVKPLPAWDWKAWNKEPSDN